VKLFGDDWISLRYIQRYPNSARTQEWMSKPVIIQSDNGLWRHSRRGYTCSRLRAGIYLMEDALSATHHCGPEKAVRYWDVSQGVEPND